MEKLRRKLSYGNVVATLALVIAVAGIPAAVAVTVNASKKSDVNKKGNIRKGRVTAKKLANGGVSAPKLASIRIESKVIPNAVTAPGEASLGCRPGERLITGGASVPPGTEPGGIQNKLLSSHPGPNNDWLVSYETGASPPPPLTIYVACLTTG
jgi:hypothetical protein